MKRGRVGHFLKKRKDLKLKEHKILYLKISGKFCPRRY